MSSTPRVPKAVDGPAGDPRTTYSHAPSLQSALQAIYKSVLSDTSATRDIELIRMRTARRVNCYG